MRTVRPARVPAVCGVLDPVTVTLWLLRGEDRWKGHLRALCQQGRGGAEPFTWCVSQRGSQCLAAAGGRALFAGCSGSGVLCLSSPTASSCQDSPLAPAPHSSHRLGSKPKSIGFRAGFPPALCITLPWIQSCKPQVELSSATD
ncbi:hypothetical protein H1C71_017972 [Ictidomys tridecemlineatus]|nr:hypothetical protein H1C71_017972 [Ictidomys tridecemlineatus]